MPALVQSRLWTLDFVLNLLVAHCLFVTYTAMYTIIPLYVVELGGDEVQLGIVIGSFGIVGLLVRPLAGRWVYSVGAKQVAAAGSAFFGLSTLLHIAAFDVWLIVPARVMQGVGMAVVPVATATIVANLAPEHRRAEAMSYMGNSIGASGLYAPVVAFWLLKTYGFESAFACASAAVLLGSLIALFLSTARTNLPVTTGPSGKVPLINRGALFPTMVFLTYTITTAPVSTFLPQLAESRELGNPGLFFTMNAMTSMASMVISGQVSDRIGRGAVIVPGLLVVALSMFILTTAHERWLFLAAGVLSGLGFGMIQAAMQALTIGRVPARERSSALATLQSAWDLGGSGGAFTFGPLASVTGAAATFAIAGCGTVLGAIGFVVGSARSSRKTVTQV